MAEQKPSSEHPAEGVKYFFRELGSNPENAAYSLQGKNVVFKYSGKDNTARMDDVFSSDNNNMFGTVCTGCISSTISGESNNIILLSNSPEQITRCIYGDLIRRTLGHLFDMALENSL